MIHKIFKQIIDQMLHLNIFIFDWISDWLNENLKLSIYEVRVYHLYLQVKGANI